MLPAISALSVISRGTIHRMGFVAEEFLLLDNYSESPSVDSIRKLGESGAQVYLAKINPQNNISLAAKVLSRQGLANPVLGTSLALDVLNNYLNPTTGDPESHFGYIPDTGVPASGKLIIDRATYNQPAANGLHDITLQIEHVFHAWNSTTGSADGSGSTDLGTSDPIVIEGGSTGGTIDEDTGILALRTLRIYYRYSPPLGSTEVKRMGYITRVMTRGTTPTLDEIYAYDNPPAIRWQSSPSIDPLIVNGPAYDAQDPTATPATLTHAGTYDLLGIYQLETNTWIMAFDTALDIDYDTVPVPYDSATYGDCLTVTTFHDGRQQLLIGNFPNTASVVSELGLADTASILRISCPRTHDDYLGTVPAGTDDLAFWRIARSQVRAKGFLQIFECYGPRTSTNYHFLFCTYQDFEPSNASLGNSLFPQPPPATHWNIGVTGSTNDWTDLDAVYFPATGAYLIGDSTAVTALSYSAPAMGADLWLFQRSPTFGALADTWDYVRGNYPNVNAFWTAMGHSGTWNPTTQTKYSTLFHANGSNGSGRYYAGSTDPWSNVVGVELY